MRDADPWVAVGDPTRREILGRVITTPSSATELAKRLPVSRPAVVQHLQVLQQAGLVDVRSEGRNRIYQARLDGLDALRREVESFWTQALATLKEVAEESYRSGGES